MRTWTLADWEEAFCRTCGDRFLRRCDVTLPQRRQTCRTHTAKPRLEMRDRPIVFDTEND